MRISCTRKIHFCSGHRVFKHESKCATMHGHNYNAFITAEADSLDGIGRVIDFSVLKEKIGGWIDEFWDHNFLAFKDDTEVVELLYKAPRKKEPYICGFNPTAENMAEFLLNAVCPLVLKGTNVTVTKIVLWETDNCFAEASLCM